ncbi:MAG: hypothetical protein COV45_09035 [Deltaproteobacteria bacterium CG11_big_fil_rev_8_21_14_0_20_47_16]|nr:MAG: hypothetical protein COV45_09035 [Deltaproteobacteria bacterium CG11_big_fil_rev_8_21_14_0_20_47_16]
MKMPRDEMPDVQHHESEGATTTPLDRLRSMSTVAHKVKSKGQQRAVDAMLAVYNGRLTYTFIAGHEVASIHFDQNRGEIFYKGHNVRNMTLGEEVRGYLWELAEVLTTDPKGNDYAGDYSATLRKLLDDNHI